MKNEHEISPTSGYFMAAITLVVIATLIFSLAEEIVSLIMGSTVALLLLIRGFFMVLPNGSCVMGSPYIKGRNYR